MTALNSSNTPNAKIAAAVRKQAPVVADNLLSMLSNQKLRAIYDGHGSCPLTAEHGKIVLAGPIYSDSLPDNRHAKPGCNFDD